MSSLSSTTLFSQNYFLLHLHSRKLLFHIPLHQNREANPPVPSNHHDSLDPYSGRSTFDANVVIVLSLLVCGLICSIGVNFMVRCALRCIRSPERPSAQIQNTGVEKKALKTFKMVKYSEDIKLELPGLDSDCVICLLEFKNGEKIRILPKCNHGFHVRCIDKWLGLHSTCPTCRTCQKFVPTPEKREAVLIISPIRAEGLVCNNAPQ